MDVWKEQSWQQLLWWHAVPYLSGVWIQGGQFLRIAPFLKKKKKIVSTQRLLKKTNQSFLKWRIYLWKKKSILQNIM